MIIVIGGRNGISDMGRVAVITRECLKRQEDSDSLMRLSPSPPQQQPATHLAVKPDQHASAGKSIELQRSSRTRHSIEIAVVAGQ